MEHQNLNVSVLTLSTTQANFDVALQARLHFDDSIDAGIQTAVTEIIAAVRARGDAAVIEYTNRFDRVHVAEMQALTLTQADLKSAFDELGEVQKAALQAAAGRVRNYHIAQNQASGQSWSYTETDGTVLGQKVTPLDRVGIYVPGGKAAYPSSVLMNAIPAHVAGVTEIIMVVPTPDGVRNPLVLAAAYVAGVNKVFTIGGAQAVAALAYGTDTVPRVDKIVGPGNAFVAEAKRRVFGQVGIDMIAGPSEILVIADGSTPADWVAMDLFSQAEHDELAQSILLCPSAEYITEVQNAIHRLIADMPRAEVIRTSLQNRGILIQTRDMNEACDIANRIAPEHLEISVVDTAQANTYADQIRHAGAIFIGQYTSESLGDYCAGPNHVLPTSGTARFSSPLGVYDFQKRSSIIQVSKQGAQTLGKIASTLAHGEGLTAHARSAELRLK
ncbi:MAG: hisD [Burkholderiaceae bacterium]|nr:hisD [Burkholderiaceae bacterium]